MPRGKKLTIDEKAHRVIGSVHLRELGAVGKCAHCKEKIEKGEKSLRYTTINHGRKQETGLCLECAKSYWPVIEEVVGSLSMELADLGVVAAEEEDDGEFRISSL